MYNPVKSMMGTHGSDVEITRAPGTAQETKERGRAMKNRRDGRHYFGFLEPIAIDPGDHIQIIGAGDVWHVVDWQDSMDQNELVQRMVFVDKRPPLARPGGGVAAARGAPPPLAVASFHAEVQKIAGPLIASGNYRGAVVDTFIGLDNYVADKSGVSDHGESLMNKVFSANTPIFALSTQTEEQKGVMFLFAGAMKAVRNPYAHKLIQPRTAEEALEWLAFASALFRLVDEAVARRSAGAPPTP